MRTDDCSPSTRRIGAARPSPRSCFPQRPAVASAPCSWSTRSPVRRGRSSDRRHHRRLRRRASRSPGGHRAGAALAPSARRAVGVVTFDRHPATVVRPESAPRLLTDPEQRLELFEETGIDATVVVPLRRAAGARGTAGVRRAGAGRLPARRGRRRRRRLPLRPPPSGQRRPRSASSARPTTSTSSRSTSSRRADGVDEPVSQHGDPAGPRRRRRRPGRAHARSAVRGPRRRRARRPAWPSARLPDRQRRGAEPASACPPTASTPAGTNARPDSVHPCAINLGRRPTFYEHADHSLLEAHLLDFDGDLYGERAQVAVRPLPAQRAQVRRHRRPDRPAQARRRTRPPRPVTESCRGGRAGPNCESRARPDDRTRRRSYDGPAGEVAGDGNRRRWGRRPSPKRPISALASTSPAARRGPAHAECCPSGVASTTSPASVVQRNVSPSGDRKLGLPLALIRSTATSPPPAGSAMASARPRIVARMKSSAAVGCSLEERRARVDHPERSGDVVVGRVEQVELDAGPLERSRLVALAAGEADDAVDGDVRHRDRTRRAAPSR